MNLGERICKLRTEKNLSQGDLADALEVSRQSVSKWETNGSVPELDKLIKLSEIFGISLDELVLDKKQPQQAAAPHVIYVEKEKSPTARKTVGTVLLCFAALLWVLVSLFGDLLTGLALAAPFIACGLICLLARKHTALWCAWVVYLFIELYLRFSLQVYTAEYTIQLIVAWGLRLSFISLTTFTALRFRRSIFPSVKNNVIPAVICWAVYLLTGLGLSMISRDVMTDVHQLRTFSYLSAVIGWTRSIVLVLALVFSTRFAVSLLERRKTQ